jgi:hypothetical protein
MPAGDVKTSFLAGFVEGEATLTILEQNGGQSFACSMKLNQRDDEQEMLERLLATTRIGRLRRVPARLTSKPQIAWIVDSQDDCLELVAVLDACGFHGRRAAELCIWRRALSAWTQLGGQHRRSTMRALKSELAASRRFGAGDPTARPFRSRDQLLGYISGFASAEGCFGLWDARPRFSIHLRQDDQPLLELLASTTGLGTVTLHRPQPPLNPSATWTVGARADLAELTNLLRRGGLIGRKRTEMEVWAVAVDELNDPAPTRREVLEAARDRLAAVRAYRPPPHTDLLRLPSRDLGQESIDALIRCGRETAGALSCTNYTRWRRGRDDAPTRNTIVRHLGSWPAALEAAGLGDRAARAPRPIGGEAGRAARRVQQRERVIEAVRAFEREYGRLPRALEFFRWRFERAVDAPTQGTVYRLFPGGWPEVLANA